MKTEIRKVGEKRAEKVTIDCVEETQEIRNLAAYAAGIGNAITGVVKGHMKNVPLSSVIYLEAVDEHVFAYLEAEVLEVKGRLYEYEESLSGMGFVRISKSVVVHLDKIESIRPALNGRFFASLSNQEEVIISRQYVKRLKQVLLKHA